MRRLKSKVRSESDCCAAADGGALLGGFVAQASLVPALEEVADTRRDECSGERRPYAVAGSDLRTVGGQGEIRIRAEVSGDFLGLQFIDIQFSGQQGRVIELEAVLDLFPGPDLRWRRGGRLRRSLRECAHRDQHRGHCGIEIYPAHQNSVLASVCNARHNDIMG